MNRTIDTVLFVLLGWLLGILGPVIVDAIKYQREIRGIRAALRIELGELCHRLAWAAFVTKLKLGEVDKAFLQRAYSAVESYKGDDLPGVDMEQLESWLTLSEGDLRAVMVKAQAVKGQAWSVRKYAVPLLDSNLARLGFDNRFQSQLLVIRTHLSTLDELVDDTRCFIRLMFDSSLSPGSRDAVECNLKESYRAYAPGAMLIADRISQIPW